MFGAKRILNALFSIFNILRQKIESNLFHTIFNANMARKLLSKGYRQG